MNDGTEIPLRILGRRPGYTSLCFNEYPSIGKVLDFTK